jgi:hypothetical protein
MKNKSVTPELNEICIEITNHTVEFTMDSVEFNGGFGPEANLLKGLNALDERELFPMGNSMVRREIYGNLFR